MNTKSATFIIIIIMNDQDQNSWEYLNSWKYLIKEAIDVYITCLVNVNIFTFLIEFPCSFKDTLIIAYFMTICMYIMKWLTGVQKLV